MTEPHWANLKYPAIDYQDIIYYSAPKQKVKPKSLDEIDPELRRTFEKLGISLDEQKRLTGVAVDAVIDSISIATTFKEQLGEVTGIGCVLTHMHQSTITVIAHPGRNTLRYNTAAGIFTQVHHLGACIGLLMVIGNGY